MRYALPLSVLFHALSILVLVFFFSKNPTNKHSPQTLQIKNVSQKEWEQLRYKKAQSTQQIIQGDKRLQTKKAPHKNQKTFLSKHNQRVDRNTRAARNGKFKNVLKEGTQSSQTAHLKPKKKKTKNLSLKKKIAQKKFTGQTINFSQRKPTSLAPPSSLKKGQGLSATDDFLDDIAIGANTLLNTQEFIYYGFYERIRAQIVDRWKSHVRSELRTRLRMHKGQHRTNLKIALNSKGALKRSTLVGSSGIDALDEAAKRAFQEAAPFPHPPKGMIQENGELEIRWDFVVIAGQKGLQINIRHNP